MQDGKTEEGVDVWAKALIDCYWIPGFGKSSGLDDKLKLIVEAQTADEHIPLQAAFKVLADSVQSVQSFLSLPYELSRLVMDEAGVPNQVAGTADHRVGMLAKALKSKTVVDQLQRVKQQAVLLLWSAYETFARDVFVYSLNQNPRLYETLIKSSLKEKFQSSQIFSYGELEKRNFSLEGRLGSAVAEGKDFSSPALLRALFSTLFVSTKTAEQISSATKSDVLWILGHRRHLVAHRGGIVDESYLGQTGDNDQRIGHPLDVKGYEIDRAITHIAMAAIAVLLGAMGDE